MTDTRLSALDGALDELFASSSADKGVVGRLVGAVRKAPTAADLEVLGADLFSVVDALDSSVALRRALTDPSIPEDARRRLTHDVLDGKVSRPATELVAEGAAMRWAGGQTFTAAVERQAVRAELVQADRTGALPETEDALFRFARLVEVTPDVRNALADRRAPIASRQRLVDDLLGGKVNSATLALARRAVRARERTFAHTIEGYIALAAAQRNRVVATVRVARPMTPEQNTRLQAALSAQVGREVGIQEVIDPDVLGGIRVELGDELIEGTVAARLDQAKRLFA